MGREEVSGERGKGVADVADPGRVGRVPGREGEGATGGDKANAVCGAREVSSVREQEKKDVALGEGGEESVV